MSPMQNLQMKKMRSNIDSSQSAAEMLNTSQTESTETLGLNKLYVYTEVSGKEEPHSERSREELDQPFSGEEG